MSGYKTYLAAAILGGAAILEALGEVELAKIVMAIGGALGLVGLRHAVEKVEAK
tara:strand:- start:775 stop:936 length:162 start_codon:yes stop_codon:yes gene_type:complete